MKFVQGSGVSFRVVSERILSLFRMRQYIVSYDWLESSDLRAESSLGSLMDDCYNPLT